MGPIVIFGAGGHATSVANVALSAGYTLCAFVDMAKSGGTLLGAPILDRPPSSDQWAAAVAAGDNAVRERIWRELRDDHPHVQVPPLVHQSAVVSVGVSLGDGSVVMPGAIIGPQTSIGRGCIINTRAAIDHDCRLEDFASMAPGAITGGGVVIGARAAIGIGAVIKHGVSVGDDAVLGAASYLHRDLPACVVAFGSPARVIRPRQPGDPYLA